MAKPLHKCIQSPQAFSELVDAYIAACLVKDDKGRFSELITVVGFAMHAGCHKGQISEWHKCYSEPNEHDPQHLIPDAIKRLKEASEWQLTQGCFKDRNAMALALGKCMHGWVEQQHVKHEHDGNVSITVSTGVPGSASGY